MLTLVQDTWASIAILLYKRDSARYEWRARARKGFGLFIQACKYSHLLMQMLSPVQDAWASIAIILYKKDSGAYKWRARARKGYGNFVGAVDDLRAAKYYSSNAPEHIPAIERVRLWHRQSLPRDESGMSYLCQGCSNFIGVVEELRAAEYCSSNVPEKFLGIEQVRLRPRQ